MHLDVPTLMLADALVCALCAGFLFFTWWQSRVGAALWWASSLLLNGLAVGLLAASFVALPLLFLPGLILLIAAPALLWCGIRAFFAVRLRPLPLAAGLALWPVSLELQGVATPFWMPTVVHTVLVLAFNVAVLWELSRHRSEHLRARVPLIVLTGVNITVFTLAIPEAIRGLLPDGEPPPLSSMFGLIHFETLFYAIGATVFLVALIKERSEQESLHEARTDVLTGLSNRRAFLPMAERIADRCQRRNVPYAVVVFDLDHFKSVNDRFGHPVGDAVLQLFARIVRESLRPGDIISRAGGEEFFAVLPDTSLKEGCATAERVRAAFEAAAMSLDGRRIGATVSAGVMALDEAHESVTKLLERADAALYRAKLAGRNCVRCGLEEPVEARYPRLVKVA